MSEETMLDFSERFDAGVQQIISQFLASKPGEKMNWPTVKADRFKKIWLDMGKTGIVRDEKGMARIKERVLSNIAMLRSATDLLGHSQVDPSEVLEGGGMSLTEEQLDRLGDFMTTKGGAWILSD